MKDHCTLWPEGWWSSCCEKHDLDYENGVDRLSADKALLECVSYSYQEIYPPNDNSNHHYETLSMLVAFVMFIGVRMFGSIFYKK